VKCSASPTKSGEARREKSENMDKNGVAQDFKKAVKLAATLVFIDERAISLSPIIMKTWSPAGKTPVIKVKIRSHQKISAIGCVATRPKCKRVRMFFRIHPGKNVKAPDCISFFEQLRQNIKSPIIVVWNRLQAHRSKKVQKYLNKIMAGYKSNFFRLIRRK
jgi:hypothetical protein